MRFRSPLKNSISEPDRTGFVLMLLSLWLSLSTSESKLSERTGIDVTVEMPTPLPRASRILLGILFFVSGALALLYEAAWQREFTLLFGNTSTATASILAAYFAGLGLGAFVLGSLGTRCGKPLVLYAYLEFTIAAGALLVAPILNLYSVFYPHWFERFHGGIGFLWIKGSLAFLSVALPTFAMGGTLPILARLFENDRDRFGRLAGWLYVLNTAGAGVGILIFPFLLESLGLARSTQVCAALNVAIGFIALALASRSRTAQPAREKITKARERRPVNLVFPALAFASGFIIFVLQVAWNRAFAQVHENSVYSFTLVVALFILAIAGGAQLARVLLQRRWTWRQIFGTCWMMGGFLVILSPQIFFQVSDGLKFISRNDSIFAARLMTPAMVVFIPVLLLGVSLPALLHAQVGASVQSVSRSTGQILSANIAGSVLGALVGGFIFPAHLGLWNTLIVSGVLAAICGTLSLFQRTAVRMSGVVVAILLGWIIAREDLPRTRIELSRGERLIALKEGAHGIVAIVDRGASRRLKLNNHYVLGGTLAAGDERLQAHLPLLLHQEPQSVAFLGYGSGITAGASLFHSVTNVLALEIVPEVLDLSNKYFAEANGAATSKIRYVEEDARNYLRGTSANYDVIVGDLVVPWRQGEGALYTIENFRAVRQRLAGLYCCWLPMFQLSRDDFEMILRTFLKVFPDAEIWRGDFSPTEPAIALVTRSAGLASAGSFAQRMTPDPTNPHLRFESALWMHFVGVVTNVPPGDLNRDDRPLIEFRRAPIVPFVGRELQQWEQQVSAASLGFRSKLTPVQQAGWQAGELMRSFTQFLSEGKEREAASVAQQIRSLLGEEVSRSVFGPAQKAEE